MICRDHGVYIIHTGISLNPSVKVPFLLLHLFEKIVWRIHHRQVYEHLCNGNQRARREIHFHTHNQFRTSQLTLITYTRTHSTDDFHIGIKTSYVIPQHTCNKLGPI